MSIIIPIIKALQHSPRIRTAYIKTGYMLEDMVKYYDPNKPECYEFNRASQNKVALCVLDFEMPSRIDFHTDGRYHTSMYYDID